MKTIIKQLVVSLVAASMLALTGCNTVRGVGQDFEAMGESIQNVGN